MKTIAYIDKGDGARILRCFKLNDSTKHLDNLFMQKRLARITEGLSELKRVGNIDIYLVKGNKKRLIISRTF